jgi:exodeoxyribonuclease V alpha subunit
MAQGEPTTIEGVLERVVYANEETAWSVVRIQPADRLEAITAVGNLMGVQIGENLQLRGRFVRDKKYGDQFKVESYIPVKPATEKGIERYLASGLVPGIGKEMARRLVERFGKDTLEVIESDAGRLREVEGIGPVRAKRILEAWEQQRDVRDVMLFLQSHGVSTAYAARIFKKYGQRAVAVVRDNPYQLAKDVFGIGFKSADRIAESIGIDKRSPRRVEAGIMFALSTLAEEGHVYADRSRLEERTESLLEIGDRAILEESIAQLVRQGDVVLERIASADALYARQLYEAEARAAERVVQLLKTEAAPISIDIAKAIAWFESEERIHLAESQRRALASAISAKVSVITGGPGTGKTTIVNGVLRVLEKKGRRILLAAPTGRAAKRLEEATGREAKTIHRLLEMNPQEQSFARNTEAPLDADMVIVDEASMIDTPLFSHLVRALPNRCQLVLVGDVDQLPSVGPGSVLKDIIESNQADVAVLDHIFRQAAESLIVVNAHRINKGEAPVLEGPGVPGRQSRPTPGPESIGSVGKEALSDFYLIEREQPEEVLATIKELASRRIPARFGVDPLDDIQVLTPMHRGSLGAANLNAELQALLNPEGDALSRGDRLLRRGDKVMQLRNNYDLGVFNGDVGRISDIDLEAHNLQVRYDEREVRYETADLDELTLAYACSIHKSQGSEYPVVIIPVSTQHFVMLKRNLLYTAVTRGKRLVVLVGSRKALMIAVRNHREETRSSGLGERIRRDMM